jgi:hypothetical protein
MFGQLANVARSRRPGRESSMCARSVQEGGIVPAAGSCIAFYRKDDSSFIMLLRAPMIRFANLPSDPICILIQGDPHCSRPQHPHSCHLDWTTARVKSLQREQWQQRALEGTSGLCVCSQQRELLLHQYTAVATQVYFTCFLCQGGWLVARC